MKKLLIILTASVFALSACENENLPNPKVNGESKVVKAAFPVLTLIGPDYYVFPVSSGTYTDSGANYLDLNTGITTAITAYSNNVDLTTEGFYSVKFRQKTNGFESFITRVVLVTSVDPAMDISGLYLRTLNSSPANVTKMDRGIYWNDNIGGAGLRIEGYMGFINNNERYNKSPN